MTGLRRWARDLDLPRRGGDEDLAPLEPVRVAEEVAPRLGPDFAGARRVTVEYARWKPGVASLVVYGLELEGGPAQVVVKRHRAGKLSALAEGDPSKGRFGAQHEVDLRFVADPELGYAAWTFPADRELPGAARALDTGRYARRFEALGLRPGWRVRRKHFHRELVRYRPEARAVFHLGVKLMGPDGEKERVDFGLRALPPRRARRIAAARRELEARTGAAPVGPRLIAHEERIGLLHEEWLDVQTFEPTAFGHVEATAEGLARLHAVERPPLPADRELSSAARARTWTARFPALDALVPGSPPAPAGPACWIHGDLHPDQIGVLRTSGRAVLLDLDAIAGGSREDDLARWIADAIAEDPACSLEDAGGGLLTAYAEASGARIDQRRLAHRVADALVDRAAGALRRLQADAEPEAATLLRAAGAALAEVDR